MNVRARIGQPERLNQRYARWEDAAHGVHHGMDLSRVKAVAIALGVRVVGVRRTGEVRFVAPGGVGLKPVTFANHGRKDAPRAATAWLLKYVRVMREAHAGEPSRACEHPCP